MSGTFGAPRGRRTLVVRVTYDPSRYELERNLRAIDLLTDAASVLDETMLEVGEDREPLEIDLTEFHAGEDE